MGSARVEVDVDVLCHRVCAATEAQDAGILTVVLGMDRIRLHSIPVIVSNLRNLGDHGGDPRK